MYGEMEEYRRSADMLRYFGIHIVRAERKVGTADEVRNYTSKHRGTRL